MSNSVDHREQCPKCAESGGDTSENNLIFFSNGSNRCFKCDHTENNVGPASDLLSGSYSHLYKRCIKQSVCEKFKYERGVDSSGNPVQIANYCDSSGRPIAQKIRYPDKRFCILGKSSGMDLYGKWLWEPNEKISITITEGEIDCLSVYQAQGGDYPVVSLPNGGGPQAEAVIKKNIEWLSKFKHITLCFDTDEVGIESAKACAEFLPPGKVKIATLPLKDANEMLQAGREAEIKTCVMRAKAVRPDSILTVGEVRSRINKVKPAKGADWPWKPLTEYTYGIQPKTLTTIGAGSGVGKTEVLIETIVSLVESSKDNIGVIFLEAPPEDILNRITGKIVNLRVHIPGVEVSPEEIAGADSMVEGRVFFYDHFGFQDIDVILNKIRYFVHGLGCKYILLDHVTALAVQMGDERRGLDEAMCALSSLSHELDCALILVSHLAKPDPKGLSYEEGKEVRPSAFRGSQSIQYWSHNIIGLERNVHSQDENTSRMLMVKVLKCRLDGSKVGKGILLKYDIDTGRLKLVSTTL